MRQFVIRLLALAWKELLHFLRDRQAIYLAFGMPLVLVILFGYAVTFDLEEVPLAVMDQDHSPASRELISHLAASDAFAIRDQPANLQHAESLLRRSQVKGLVLIPRGYHTALRRLGRASYQLLIDGADGTAARQTIGYAMGISQAQTEAQLRSALGPKSRPVHAAVRTWFNPRGLSALFIVPGLGAVVLAVISVLLTGLSVAREWERGSMEQLFSTPVDRLSIVLGKLLPYAGIGVIQFLLVIAAGAWLFDVPCRGSFSLLMLCATLFLACVIGQGLLISTITRSQQLAVQVGALASLLPSLLISGFMFPIDNMPRILQLASHLVPARYMIVCLRGILLQGRGFTQLWPSLLGMALLAIFLLGLCTVIFRRRLD